MQLKRLLAGHLWRPYRHLLAGVVVLQAIQAFAMLAIPSINADLIDKGVLTGDNAYIRRAGLFMILFTAVQAVFAIAAVWVGSRAAMGFGRNVRADLFHSVTSFSAREVGHFGAPSLITRITNDVQQVQMLVVLAATMMISAPLMMIIGTVMAIREDTGLSVVLAVSIPLTVGILGLVISRMIPSFQLMQVRIDRINSVLREQITGMRVVRAFVREPEEEARFAQANDDLTEVSLRTGRLTSLMFPTVGLIMNLTSVAVIWVGASRIDSGAIAPGSIVAYLTYVIQILMGVVMATFMMSMIPRSGVAAERIMEVLDAESSVHPPADPVTAQPTPGTLEFRDAGFRYPGADRSVLQGVSFRVEPGHTLAVIGSTGSGKTTLVQLVSRLFDATDGEILVGGVDVRDLDPSLLWGRVGYVPQQAFLFSGTVATNLRYGRPDASDAELWDALEVAQASGFVQSMPDGIDSTIVQGGTNVSGGQRQRLSIARALVARPDIYVFDDSFSALDLATEARLRSALSSRLKEASTLIVAQRVSSIRHADEIIVLDGGAVVGQGSHDDLLAGCVTYAQIVESQETVGVAP